MTSKIEVWDQSHEGEALLRLSSPHQAEALEIARIETQHR